MRFEKYRTEFEGFWRVSGDATFAGDEVPPASEREKTA
jgi:hypothetical protein